MSSEFRVPQGPPWDVDVVADVHAGVYPAELTAELLRTISADAEGAAILAALDSTVDELSLLPPLVMPEQYARRLDSVLASLAAQAFAARTTTTTVTARAGIGALLQSGPGRGGATAPPGLPRPQTGPQTAPQTSSPGGLPRQIGGATDRRPMVPPRHGPVIPRVLPGGPQQGRPAATAPSTTPPSNEATRSTSVTDLQSARDRAGQRPAAPGTSSTPPRVGSLEAQRTKRRRWTGGLLAAAAVVAIGGITTLALNRGGDSNGDVAGTATSAPVTVPTQLPSNNPGAGQPSPQALVLEPGRFGDQLDEIEGKAPADDTSLTNPTTYASCLAANDITGTVTGVTEVTYEGQDAYAIAVDASSTTVRIVVVGLQCGQNGESDTLDSQTVDR